MRTENTEANWRVRLGIRARQLVLGVMAEDDKPDGELLERALSLLDQSLAQAEGRVAAGEAAITSITQGLQRMGEGMQQALDHNAMMLGIVYRQLYTCRQVLALVDAPSEALGQVIEKSLEVLQNADLAYRRLIPEAERRYPDFEQKLEDAFIEKLAAAEQGKASDRSKSPSKNEEKER